MATHKEAIRAAIYAWYGDTETEMAAEEYAHFMEAAIRAYLDAMDAVIVPKEPTGEMTSAGKRSRNAPNLFTADDAYHVYHAMLSAAPNPFKDEDNDR